MSGFAAETGAAVALFASTYAGAPVSTTQTVTGAVSGAGLANREASVDWSVFGRVALAWVLTLPFAALFSACAYVVTTELPPVLAGVFIVVALLGVGFLVFRSMRTAPSADDVEEELRGERDDEAPADAPEERATAGATSQDEEAAQSQPL